MRVSIDAYVGARHALPLWLIDDISCPFVLLMAYLATLSY